MQDYELLKMQYALTSALNVRSQVSGLLDLAHEIMLVSLNSQITSAQIGIAGRVFSVMTSEITAISSDLHNIVGDIRRLTQEWTRLTAIGTQQMRNLNRLEKANSLIQAKGRVFEALKTARVKPMSLLKDYQDNYPRLLSELFIVIDGMEKSLKIVNYVKIGILIESERLNYSGRTGVSPFQHLTTEMQSAANKIRTAGQQAMQLLKAISNSSFDIINLETGNLENGVL